MPLNALSSHLWNIKGNTFRFRLRTWGWADGIWTSRWCSGHHQDPGRLFPRTRKEGSQRRVRTVFKEKRKSSKAEKWPWASDTQEPQTVSRRTSQESTEGQSRHRQCSVTLALWDETWEWCQQSGLCGARWTWTWDRTGLRLDDHLVGGVRDGIFPDILPLLFQLYSPPFSTLLWAQEIDLRNLHQRNSCPLDPVRFWEQEAPARDWRWGGEWGWDIPAPCLPSYGITLGFLCSLAEGHSSSKGTVST